MADFARTPLEDQFETQLVGEISSGATCPFNITVKKAVSFTPQTDGFRIIMEPGTSKAEGMIVTAVSGTTWTIGTRGVPIAKGGSDSTTTHGGGATIIITDTWSTFDDMTTVMNTKTDATLDETVSGNWTFTGNEVFSKSIKVPVFADDTARDAAIPSPANGMECYRTDTGKFEDYTAGSWIERESGGTFPNASTTAAGKVEIATQAELDAGTDTGGTGASLVGVPSNIAECVQQQNWTFAADAEASDDYAITIAPAIDDYATGQRFTFTANTANTGAATLNVNAKGAKDIVKGDSSALTTGDILAGQIVEVVYDGTNMVMTSIPDALVSGGDASSSHTHESADPYAYWWVDTMPIGSEEAAATVIWDEADNGGGSKQLGSGAFSFTTAAANGNFESVVRNICFTGADQLLDFDDLTAGQKVIFEVPFKVISTDDCEFRIGFGENILGASADTTDKAEAKFRLVYDTSSVLTAVAYTNDGSGAGSTDSFTYSDATNMHMLRIEWTPGTNVIFKVDGTTVSTVTSDIPTISTNAPIYFFIGVKTVENTGKQMHCGNQPYIAIQRV